MRAPARLRVLWSRQNLGPNLLVVWLLAVGLGAGTLLYSAADRLILRPLHVSEPDRLVRAGIQRSQLTTRDYFEYKDFEIAKGVRGLSATAADAALDVTAALPGTRPVAALAHMVSGGYFGLLQAAPELGRVLGNSDEKIGSSTAGVVLSDAFRTRLFGDAPNVLGSKIQIQGRPFVVIGVMPQGFVGISLDSAADLWLPFSAQAVLSTKPLQDPESDRSYAIFGRLANGRRMSDAAAEFDTLYQTDALATKETNPGKVVLEPIDKGAFSEHEQFSHALILLLWGFVVMLAMTVVNVGTVLLVRSSRRAGEVSIEVALGASRARIVGEGLFEALFLGLAGASAAVAIDYCLAPALTGFLPPGRIPASVYLRPGLANVRLIFVAAAALSFLFGVIPAWSASRVEPQNTLRRGTATRTTTSWTRILMVAQIAGTVLILMETALMIRTYGNLLRSDIGFDVHNLTAFTINPASGDVSTKASPSLPSDLLAAARGLSRFEAACLASAPLMQRIGLKTSAALPGSRIERSAFLNTSFINVSEGYFSTLKIPILAGRALSRSDASRSKPTPVVIDAALARLLFGGRDPVGRRFGSGPPGSIAGPKFLVVGVAADSKYRSLREPMLPIFYAPFEMEKYDGEFTEYVRADGPGPDLVRGMRAALFRLNPTLAFSDVATVRQQVRDSVWGERLTAALGLILSAVSVLMAATGLYGLQSYDVNRRNREFGIRLAVGATAADLAALLAKESARMLAPGVVVGLVAHQILVPYISPFLFGVRAFDPVSLVCALLLFGIISMVAVGAPIRRAMTIAPVVVLSDQG